MISSKAAYSVLALTEARFQRLMEIRRRVEVCGGTWEVIVQSFHVPDLDTRGLLAEFAWFGDAPERLFLPPIFCLQPRVNGVPLLRGEFSSVVFRHQAIEAYLQGVMREVPVSLPLTLDPVEMGMRILMQGDAWRQKTCLEVWNTPFQPDETIDRTWWWELPRDEGFLRRSMPGVFRVGRDEVVSRPRSLAPCPPLLDDARTLGFELLPGMWLALPRSREGDSVLESAPPVLLVDPLRYGRNEGIDRRAVLCERETFWAADLSAFGTITEWEGLIESVLCGGSLERVRDAVVGLCVELTNGRMQEEIRCRAFVWARYLDS